MKVKLKTIEQIANEFDTDYNPKSLYGFHVYYNDEELYIHKDMFKYFGKEIEVEKISYSRYTHKQTTGYKWGFHESWFMKEDFLKEEEFLI